MISTILFCICTAIAVASFIANRKTILKINEYGSSVGFSLTAAAFPILLFVFGIIGSLINPFSLERVDAGNVGIKVKLTGDDRGVSAYEYKTGWVIFNNWTEMLYEFPTYQQHIDYDEQIVITKGGFSTIIKPSFNYSLVPNTIGDMFVNLRLPIKEIELGWLKTAIVSSVNDVANTWEVDSIFNSREQFESAIINECNKRVTKWFNVSQLRTNILPPPALQASIEAKTKAIQEAQVADNQKLVAIAEGLKRLAVAKADSATIVTKAKGEALAAIEEALGTKEVMRLKREELTPLYVEYLKVMNWNGANPTTVLGSNTSTLVTVGK